MCLKGKKLIDFHLSYIYMYMHMQKPARFRALVYLKKKKPFAKNYYHRQGGQTFPVAWSTAWRSLSVRCNVSLRSSTKGVLLLLMLAAQTDRLANMHTHRVLTSVCVCDWLFFKDFPLFIVPSGPLLLNRLARTFRALFPFSLSFSRSLPLFLSIFAS